MDPKLDDSVEIQPKSYDDNLENQDDVNLGFNNALPRPRHPFGQVQHDTFFIELGDVG